MRRIAALSLVAGTTAALVTTPVAAAAPTTAALSVVTPRISANSKPVFTVKVTNPPAGSGAYLQRQFGPSHTWKTLLKIAKSGKVVAPPLPGGRYLYRVLVTRYGKFVAVSPLRYVYSYVKVTMAQMCAKSTTIAFPQGCTGGTVTAGGDDYTYVTTWSLGEDQITASQSSCRAAAISYATYDEAESFVRSAFTQPNAAAQQGDAVINRVGKVVYTISSPVWKLYFGSEEGATVFANGYFSCWTLSGNY